MESATNGEIERMKKSLNEEWYRLVDEEIARTDKAFERLRKEGRMKNKGLDGIEPPEIKAIDDEFKPKFADVLRRYRKLIGKKENHHDEL